MSDVQSQLARHQAKPALSEAQLLALAARAWHEYGIICLRPEELRDEFNRQAVVNAAVELFGKRADG